MRWIRKNMNFCFLFLHFGYHSNPCATGYTSLLNQLLDGQHMQLRCALCLFCELLQATAPHGFSSSLYKYFDVHLLRSINQPLVSILGVSMRAFAGGGWEKSLLPKQGVRSSSRAEEVATLLGGSPSPLRGSHLYHRSQRRHPYVIVQWKKSNKWNPHAFSQSSRHLGSNGCMCAVMN